MKHVWIVEWLQGKIWIPCACVSLTRRDALREIEQYWKVNFDGEKFRTKKYTRESK